MQLSKNTEEIATFYALIIRYEIAKQQQFNINFFKDWRKSMTSEERKTITDLSKCDFGSIHEYLHSKMEYLNERKVEIFHLVYLCSKM